MLRQNNEQEVLKQIGKNVHSWSSGTKIGESLTEFLSEYGSKFLSQKHIVVILSDGLETGNVDRVTRSSANHYEENAKPWFG